MKGSHVPTPQHTCTQPGGRLEVDCPRRKTGRCRTGPSGRADRVWSLVLARALGGHEHGILNAEIPTRPKGMATSPVCWGEEPGRASLGNLTSPTGDVP